MTLVKPDTGEIVKVLAGAQELAEILDDNLGGRALTPSMLERIKIPTGGLLKWIDPNGNPYDYVEGVIIAHRITRSYWPKSFDETGGGVSPDCVMHDLKTDPKNPMGSLPEPPADDRSTTPGGACNACPMNVFGSGRNGVGKACKETHLLFIIREGEALPAILSATPGSLRAIDHYFVGLASKRLKPHYAMHRLSLEAATSSNGVAYARILPLEALGLTEDGREQADQVATLLRDLLGQVEVDRGDIDGVESDAPQQTQTPGETYYGHHVEQPELGDAELFDPDGNPMDSVAVANFRAKLEEVQEATGSVGLTKTIPLPHIGPKTREAIAAAPKKLTAVWKRNIEAAAWEDLMDEVTGTGWNTDEWVRHVLKLPKVDWYKMGQNAASARVRWEEHIEAEDRQMDHNHQEAIEATAMDRAEPERETLECECFDTCKGHCEAADHATGGAVDNEMPGLDIDDKAF